MTAHVSTYKGVTGALVTSMLSQEGEGRLSSDKLGVGFDIWKVSTYEGERWTQAQHVSTSRVVSSSRCTAAYTLTSNQSQSTSIIKSVLTVPPRR